MRLYEITTNTGSKLMSYSRYDVTLLKHIIHNYLNQLNQDILDSEDDCMIQSVVSNVDSSNTKNSHRVLELAAYTSYQCYQSYKGISHTDYMKLNYTNNDRMHMFTISESKLFETDFYIKGLGQARVVSLEGKKHIKNMKCKLGWIKSTNRDKVGF